MLLLHRLAELAWTQKVLVLDFSLGMAASLSAELLAFQKQLCKHCVYVWIMHMHILWERGVCGGGFITMQKEKKFQNFSWFLFYLMKPILLFRYNIFLVHLLSMVFCVCSGYAFFIIISDSHFVFQKKFLLVLASNVY